MMTLTQLAGMPFSYNADTQEFSYDSEELYCESVKHVSLEEIIPGLLNKSLRYPERVYKQHCRVVSKQDMEKQWTSKFTYDVTIIPSGLLGIEYNKTHVFKVAGKQGKVACIVQVFSGTLTLYIQRNRKKIDPYSLDVHADDVSIIDVEAGNKVVVPSGYYYTFVNAGDETVVFATVVSKNPEISYEALRKVNGLAYYLIAKNARQEIVANPRYRTIAPVKHISISELNSLTEYGQREEKPVVSLYAELNGYDDILNSLFS